MTEKQIELEVELPDAELLEKKTSEVEVEDATQPDSGPLKDARHSQTPVGFSSNSQLHGLETRLEGYSGVSPFRRYPKSSFDWVKAFLMTITGIIIVKTVLFVLLLLFCYVFSVFATCCISDRSKPLPKSRMIWKYALMGCVRLILFVFGFYWIPVTRLDKSGAKVPRLIVPNHHTAFDAFIMFWLFGGTAAAMSDLRETPIVGRIGDALNVIWIERKSKEGRKRAIQQIIDHVKNEKLPKLIIFPQGICTSIRAVTSFKSGAFIPGQSVQPVALNYRKNIAGCCNAANHDLSWTLGNIGVEFFWAGVQLINWSHVTVCQPHAPTEEEKHNAQLFGKNVRNEIVAQLSPDVMVTRHAFDDLLLLKKARDLVPDLRQGCIVMQDISTRLQFRTKTVITLAHMFSACDRNGDGFVDFAEFCETFGRDESAPNMRPLFELFNPNPDIGFEEFLIGVAICYVDSLRPDALVAFFKGMDLNRDDHITLAGMRDVLERATVSMMTIKQYASTDEFSHKSHKSTHSQKATKGFSPNFAHKFSPEMSPKPGDVSVASSVSTPPSLVLGKLGTQRMTAFRDTQEIDVSRFDPFIAALFPPADDGSVNEENIDFETFRKRIEDNGLGEAVQGFMQFLICVRGGIKLEAEDFAHADMVVSQFMSAPANRGTIR